MSTVNAQLVEDNIQLVMKIAHKQNPKSHEDFEDYVQVGAMALLKALPKYNSGKGAFSTFTWHVVRNAIINHKLYEQRRYAPNISRDFADMISSSENDLISEYLPQLSKEEKTVVDMKLAGYTNKEIGEKLGFKSPHSKVRKILNEVKEKCSSLVV